MENLGLIAGGGQFPLMVAEAARKKGLRIIAVAHIGETDLSLADRVDEIVWIKLGQLGHLIKSLKKNGVCRALMAGSITKRRMFENVMPDLAGAAVISRLAIFHDDNILKAVDRALAKEGIEIISSVSFLSELFAEPGYLTKRRPGRAEKEDIRFGWNMAKELGRLDIGQCLVVRKKTVLAVEAIEGTDETIRRGGALAREKAVVVKVCKPNQDLRFDLPTVGFETVKTMSSVRASALAIEAGKTLVFNRKEMVDYADNSGIAIISI